MLKKSINYLKISHACVVDISLEIWYNVLAIYFVNYERIEL